MRIIVVGLLSLTLAGCLTQARVEQAEREDDQSCRKLLTERGQNPNDPQAYSICRQNLQSYRRDRAIRSAAD